AAGEIEPYHEKQPDGTYKFYHKTDFYNTSFKKWRSMNIHNISVSGGSEKLNGYFSGRIYKREKVQDIQDAYMKRYNLNFKMNLRRDDWLELSGNSRFSKDFNEEYAGTINGWGGVYGFARCFNRFVNWPAQIDGLAVDVGRRGTGALARL